MASYTHGSPERPPRPLDGGLRVVDVAEVAAGMRSERAFVTDGRDSETIVSDGPARVIVAIVDEGRDIGGDTSNGHVSIILLDGNGVIARGGEEKPVRAGCLAVLAPGAAWHLHVESRTTIVASFWQPG
jgi:hypothetical protein